MQRSTTTLTILASFLSLMLLFGLYKGSESWRGYHDSNNPAAEWSNRLTPQQHGVVLLTGLTTNKLKDFEGVDDFYGKLWNNRLTFTVTHGTLIPPLCTCRLTKGYSLNLVDMKDFQFSNTSHPVWAKMPAISATLDKFPLAEWVWWLDADAIIMTPHIDLYEYLLSPAALKNNLIHDEAIRMNDRVPIHPKDPIPKGEKVAIPFPLFLFICRRIIKWVFRISIPRKSRLSALKIKEVSMLAPSSFVIQKQ
jgi:hypothetical protein